MFAMPPDQNHALFTGLLSNYIQDWVEKKIRRHLMRSRKRRGFGWQRWSKQWLYECLGLFHGYRVSRTGLKA